MGKYIGYSEKKTKEVLNDPEYNVLMIEEAYTLGSEFNDIFGREALDAINTYLSSSRNKHIILDQYPNHSSLSRKISWNI